MQTPKVPQRSCMPSKRTHQSLKSFLSCSSPDSLQRTDTAHIQRYWCVIWCIAWSLSLKEKKYSKADKIINTSFSM